MIIQFISLYLIIGLIYSIFVFKTFIKETDFRPYFDEIGLTENQKELALVIALTFTFIAFWLTYPCELIKTRK